MAARITLINVVLTALPLFYLSFFRAPKAVINRLTVIQRQFLWGGNREGKKIAWISWRQCCASGDVGGLGIKDIKILNNALLIKWKWLMFHQPHQLWNRILISKYKGWRGLDQGPQKYYFSPWWADLRAINQHQSMIAASNQFCWKVGRGDQILFWEDSWVDDGTPLKDQFPELYRISSQRNFIMADMGSFSENGWDWNLLWRRNLFDNEMGIASKFIEHITAIRLNSNLKDTWVWRAETNGIFSTKSAYQVIKAEQPYEVQHLGFHQLWDIKIPPRALSFAWRLLWDRLPTKDNLSRRQIQTDSDLCPFCHSQPESASHLFFTCDKVLPLWWKFFSWVKEVRVIHCRLMDNFLQHSSTTGSMATNRRWKIWWLTVTNSI